MDCGCLHIQFDPTLTSMDLWYKMFVDEETFIDISTSISGSGPAYIFMLMEAMIDAGKINRYPGVSHSDRALPL